MSDSSLGFTLAVHHNRYLAPADSVLDAAIAIDARATAGGAVTRPPAAAEVILVDSSGSMNYPPGKMIAARRATRAAVRTLRDGVRFAVVAGANRPRMIYPDRAELAVAGPRTRAAADRAIGRLRANGGTAIGTWLGMARGLLADYPDAIRHCLLFTDGKNEHENPDDLESVLADCAGQFTCDARGIGADWQPAEVLRIASALGGHADAVREYADLAGDLRDIMARAMRKRARGVRLRVRTMDNTEVRMVKQVYPSQIDLSDRLVTADGVVDGVVDADTGSWGDEHREYHLSLAVDSTGRDPNEDNVAARVELLDSDSTVLAGGLVLVQWTEDAARSVLLDRTVAHILGEAELSAAIEAGCAAKRRGDVAGAEHEFGTAARLAHRHGNTETLRRLARLVTIIDAPTGHVRVKTDSELIDLLSAEMVSMLTTPGAPPERPPVPVEPDAVPDVVPDVEPDVDVGPDPVCANCGEHGLPGDAGCEACGTPYGGGW